MLLFLLLLLLLLPLHRPLPFLIIRSDRAAKPRPFHVASHPDPLLCPFPFCMCPHWSFVVPQFWPQFNFLVMHIAAAIATPILFIRHAHSRTIQTFPSPPLAALLCCPLVNRLFLQPGKMLVILQQLRLPGCCRGRNVINEIARIA